ncbi:MAG: substrate-binding domain-containing protein, partial [Aestuariivirga sp.]|nr:substrate-binding domain-containing protein [Aestuariivirga sp.]
TRSIVLGAAQRLGYVGEESSPQEARTNDRTLRFVFVFPPGTNSFIRLLGQQIEGQALGRAGIVARVEELEGFNPQSLAERLLALRGEADGVGLIAQDHPLVRDAIRALHQAGVPVVTLASDVLSVPRLAYVGIDNRQAGRLAGQLMGRFLCGRNPAKVALFAGSLSYRGHEEREVGFRSILRDEFPNIHIMELREILDDSERGFSETRSLLASNPDLAGIYNVGGGTEGIARALKDAGTERSVVLIGHEATDNNKRLLLDGTLDAVIDQNPRVEAREALNLLTASARGEKYSYIAPRLQVVFRENIPDE